MKSTFQYIFLFISLVALGQRNHFTKGLDIDKNYYTEITFEFISEKIIIPVVIEGQEYKFILDTGAPNVISKKLKKNIKSKHISSINVTDATSKKDKLDIVSIPLITIGGVSFRNSPTLTDNSDNNILFDCLGIDGIIGSNILYKSILQIDLNRKIIILTDKAKQLKLNIDNASKLDLVNAQKSPYVWITLGNTNKVKEHLLIDTGMKGFYDLTINNLEFLNKNKVSKILSSSIGSTSISLFGSAKESQQYQVHIPDLKLNNATFKNVLAETTSDTNSRLGTEILNYGIVTINFKNKRFYFESNKTKNNINEETIGFKPTIINNKLVVGMVWNDQLKKEMNFGDEIIKINDMDIASIPLCNFINGEIQITNKKAFEMTIKRQDNSLKTFQIKKSYFNIE
jgi:predicted aspartyl protease